jgi:phosphopantetheinyl transferase
MIALLCATLPQSLTADEAVKEALSLFPSRENGSYFDKLRGEKSDEGVKESFFAIVTLAAALKMLSRRINTENLIFAKSKTGKPFFVNSEVRFSISHSRGRVTCAVSDCGDVGVDTEWADIDDEKAKRLANRYFTKEEADTVEKYPRIFKEMWCEKEAITKFFGQELSVFLKEEREIEKSSKSEEFAKNYSIDRFTWGKNPVILCSEHNNSTIVFKIQP